MIINHYQEIINKYIQLREEYEKAFYTLQYSKAWSILCEIEKECGYSFWLIEQQFGVLDCLNMKNQLEELLQAYQRMTHNGLIVNILKYMKWRKSRNISYTDYERYVNNILSQKKEDALGTKYLKYKIMLKTKNEKYDFLLYLQIDEAFSLVDLYETVIDTLFHLVYNKDVDLPIDSLKEMANQILDNRIKTMLIYRGESFVIKENIQQKKIAELLEKYSLCKWNEAEALLEKYIQENSNDFMMLHLYIKCNIFQNKELLKPSELEQAVYCLYTMSKDMYELKIEFENFLKFYYGTNWQYKIEAIINRKILCQEDEFSKFISVCYDKQITPMFVKIMNKSDRTNFLQSFESVCPYTVKSVMKQYGLLKDNFHVTDIIKDYYLQICSLYEKQDFQTLVTIAREAFIYLETNESKQSFKRHKAYFYHKGRIARYLFRGLLEVGDISGAIELFGTMFFQKELLVKRLSIYNLIEKIELAQESDDEDLNFLSSIYVPIIFHYFYGNENPEKVIIVYRDFMYFNNVHSLDEWKNNIGNITQEQIYFLFEVCVPSLLQLDFHTLPFYKSDIKLRIAVLRFLIEKDNKRKKRYVEELNSIYSAEELKDRVRLVNKDRIHVEVDKLYVDMEEFLKNEFGQYLLQQKLSKELVNTSDVGSKIESEQSDLESEDVLRYYSEHNFYKFIINEIIEEYLFNRSFGLNTYLGTRIRHNYCRQNLFSVFEKWNLLSKKEKNHSTEYLINDFWCGKMDKNKEKILLEILNIFSKKMNQMLTSIKDEWIQIKKEGQEGLFDYSDMCDRIYDYTLIVRNSYENVFYTVIKELNIRTINILEKIRSKIGIELKEFFDEQLNWLKREIQGKNFPSEIYNELSFNIQKCMEELPETIYSFQDIFHFENISYPDFTIQTVIGAYAEIFKRLYTDVTDGCINCNIKTDRKFPGYMFPYWIDIMGILFQNAKEYCKYPSFSDAEFLIESECQEENGKKWFVLKVSNKLKCYTKDEINSIRQKLDAFLINIVENNILEESMKEHGSGFYKIARIIKYNFEKEARYSYKINQNLFSFQFQFSIKNEEELV